MTNHKTADRPIHAVDRASHTNTSRLVYPLPFAPFLLLLSCPAHAAVRPMDRPDFVPTERVFIGDLNLATPTGFSLAKARVRRAATRVCAVQPTMFAAVQCRDESLQLAQQELARRRVGWQRAATAKE